MFSDVAPVLSLNVPLATTLTIRLWKEEFKVCIFNTSLCDSSSLFRFPGARKDCLLGLVQHILN